ncbi:MAG TPA: hypothetical protein VFR81_26685 [Longimicrobium sp.]|nr:hypothetical protein [Longimicrobium sp.]
MSTPPHPRPGPAPSPDTGRIAVSAPVFRAAVGPQAAAEPGRISFPVNVVGEGEGEGAPAKGGGDGGGKRRRVAVVISHGIGQQVPYENIDLIAGALERTDRPLRTAKGGAEGNGADSPASRDDAAPPRPRVRFARLGKQWLPRAEVTLQGGEIPTEAHVYEIYWAPLTEGRVSAFDVTRFLLGAGARGIQYAVRGRWDRWIFGGPKTFEIGWTALAILLVAFAVVLSTLVLYGALAVVATLEVLRMVLPGDGVGSLAGKLSAVLGTGLLRTPLAASLLLIPGMVFLWAWRIAVRFIPDRVRGKARSIGGIVIVLAAGGAAVLLGLVPLAMILATRSALAAAVMADAPAWLTQPGLGRIVPAAVAALFAGAALLSYRYTRGASREQEPGAAVGGADSASREREDGAGGEKRKERPAGWMLPATVVTLAILIGAWLVVSAGGLAQGAANVLADGVTRATDPVPVLGRPLFLVFLASAAYLCWKLRGLYIQYVGDVVVYVSSHQLNEFAELRAQIRARGFDTTCAVYGARGAGGDGWEYDEVVLAGHSLGSLVAYDTLNGMLNEDRVLGGAMEVEKRTRALVTFGSPLDKTAFIFRTQLKNASYREALAAAVQPLIEPVAPDEDAPPRGRRIPWRNVHSPFDPVSSFLRYYDPPAGAGDPPGHVRVDNRPDRRAAIFGYAHLQYWDNPELVSHLHEALTSARLATR